MNRDPAGASVWGYVEWLDEVAQAFLRPRAANVPFTMFLDDDEARRLWPELENPAESLCTAVGKALAWHLGSGLFAPVRPPPGAPRDEGPPRSLPLLAVTVIAATRMRGDGTFAQSAYYARLAQALRPGLEGAELIAARDQVSRGFDDVADMWREFAKWIVDQGKFGASTIRDHPRFTRIGYPLSQAIIRESDRMVLTRFFAAMGLKESAPPSTESLRWSFDLWRRRPRGFSDTFLSSLSDPELNAVVMAEVQRLATAWDGLVRLPGGSRRLQFRVVLDLEDIGSRWTAQHVEGVEGDTLVTDDGHTITIEASPSGTSYRIQGAPAPTAWLSKKVSARGSKCSAVIDLPEIFPARESAAAGGWVSTDGLEPHVEHILVVSPSHKDAMQRALEANAAPGWKFVPQRLAEAVLPGRLLYRFVRFADPLAFQRALIASGIHSVRGIDYELPPRPRLINGLRVARHLGPNHYLAGGEPDLLLPIGREERAVEATLNGRAQKPPFRAKGLPIQLRRQGPFDVGRHELVADGTVLEFHIHDHLPPEPASVVAGWIFDLTTMRLRETPSPAVAGAFVDLGDSEREPLLLRRSGEYRVATRQGVLRRLTPPSSSAWLSGLSVSPSQYWEFLPSPDDVWLIRWRSNSPERPVLLRWSEPNCRTVSSHDREAFAQVETRWADSHALLPHYLKVVLSA